LSSGDDLTPDLVTDVVPDSAIETPSSAGPTAAATSSIEQIDMVLRQNGIPA
jgi:hypothetical protein